VGKQVLDLLVCPVVDTFVTLGAGVPGREYCGVGGSMCSVEGYVYFEGGYCISGRFCAVFGGGLAGRGLFSVLIRDFGSTVLSSALSRLGPLLRLGSVVCSLGAGVAEVEPDLF
jgi:hypothetical protein